MEYKVKGGDDNSSTDSNPDRLALKDETEQDLRYGCLGFKPRWLQGLNTIVGFVGWLSLANCLQSMANGLIGVVMSTLEKRFDFSSTESAWIASAYEMGPIPVIIVISYFGNRIHRPLSCAVGLLAVVVGCVMFFIPQFTTPPYRPNDDGDQGLCNLYQNRTTKCDPNEEDLSNYLPIFIVARLLIGMGSTPILTLGVTYMDDCSYTGKFATYTGVFNAMSVIGPALAYVVGAMMLGLFVDFYAIDKSELGISSNDPLWVGAWWLPYTIAAGLSLLNAVPMFGYPRDLPGAADIRRTKVSEAHNDDSAGESNPAQIAIIKTWAEFKKLFASVFTNPAFLGLTLFTCCDNFLIAAFTAYGPKVFEVSFTLSAGAAGAIFGVVLMPAGAGGTIVGGVVIEKMKLTCKQIIRAQTVLAGIVTAGILLLLITCNPLNFAGVNTMYNASLTSEAYNVTDVCNVGCDCQHVAYNPICSHDNLMYFSPCHAGCELEEEYDDYMNYYNCSCIANRADGNNLEATSKVCSAESCPFAIAFLIIFFFAVAFIFVCLTMNMAATLRCVSSSQTSFAFSVQFLIGKLCGTMLGPIFFGMAFDNSCVLWQYHECGERGNCLFYDNKVFSANLTLTCFIVKLVSFVAMILALVFYKPPEAADTVVKEVPPSPSPSYGDDEVAIGTHVNAGHENDLPLSGVQTKDADGKVTRF